MNPAHAIAKTSFFSILLLFCVGCRISKRPVTQSGAYGEEIAIFRGAHGTIGHWRRIPFSDAQIARPPITLTTTTNFLDVSFGEKKTMMRIFPESELLIKNVSSTRPPADKIFERQLELRKGKILVITSAALTRYSRFEIGNQNFGVIGVRGTPAAFEFSDGMRLRVLAGTIVAIPTASAPDGSYCDLATVSQQERFQIPKSSAESWRAKMTEAEMAELERDLQEVRSSFGQ